MIHNIPLNSESHADALKYVTDAVYAGGMMLSIAEREKDRSNAQNALSFKIYEHLGNHEGASTMDARCHCKYHFGVPILIGDDESMMEWFKAVFSNLDKETRLTAMQKFPVTSLMKVKQFTRYLENIYNHYDPLGYMLPRPPEIYEDAMGIKR